MPPSTVPDLATMAQLRWRLSITSRAMYSFGMLGSCLLMVFFRLISLHRTSCTCLAKSLVFERGKTLLTDSLQSWRGPSHS